MPADVRDARTLRRWYWLHSELAEIARRIGVGGSDGKIELTDRICVHLDQRTPPRPVVPRRTRNALPAELTEGVVLLEGQRCTQQLRVWMRTQVGPGFTFDEPMRMAVAAGGITLCDLVAHWDATRAREPREIGAQFELNRFSRAWHACHSHGTHAQMLAEWAQYRSRPGDTDTTAGPVRRRPLA